MIIVDVLFLNEWVILTATAPMHSITNVMNLATFHRTDPTRFLPQEHQATKTNLIQGINIPTSEGTDHTQNIMVSYMGDIVAGHSPITIPTMTEAADSEGTPQTPHLTTTAVHAIL